MYFNFCISSNQDYKKRLGLDTIFYVQGDKNYSTPYKEITPNKIYFAYTLKGDGTISYDNKTFSLSENEYIFMTPSKSFNYHCTNEIWEFWWFETTETPHLLPLNIPIKSNPGDIKLELFSQSLQWAKIDRWDIAENLYEAAIGILHHYHTSNNNTKNQLIFSSCDQFIRDNIKTVNVQVLCETLDIKPRTLRNIFYATQGYGPKQYIDNIRLSFSLQWLENTTLSIQKISDELGYSSQFHFSKAFKQSYNVSPAQHRAQHHIIK